MSTQIEYYSNIRTSINQIWHPLQSIITSNGRSHFLFTCLKSGLCIDISGVAKYDYSTDHPMEASGSMVKYANYWDDVQICALSCNYKTFEFIFGNSESPNNPTALITQGAWSSSSNHIMLGQVLISYSIFELYEISWSTSYQTKTGIRFRNYPDLSVSYVWGIVYIERGLWQYVDNLAFEDSADFKARYPLYKTQEDGKDVYRFTADLTTSGNYTFLTTSALDYSLNNSEVWSSGHANNFNQSGYGLNPAPTDSDGASKADTAANYIKNPNNARWQMKRFGVDNQQLSTIPFKVMLSSCFFEKQNRSLPAPVYTRDSPWILIDTIGDFYFSTNKMKATLHWIDQFVFLILNPDHTYYAKYYIPLNWSVHLFSRYATNLTDATINYPITRMNPNQGLYLGTRYGALAYAGAAASSSSTLYENRSTNKDIYTHPIEVVKTFSGSLTEWIANATWFGTTTWEEQSNSFNTTNIVIKRGLKLNLNCKKTYFWGSGGVYTRKMYYDGTSSSQKQVVLEVDYYINSIPIIPGTNIPANINTRTYESFSKNTDQTWKVQTQLDTPYTYIYGGMTNNGDTYKGFLKITMRCTHPDGGIVGSGDVGLINGYYNTTTVEYYDDNHNVYTTTVDTGEVNNGNSGGISIHAGGYFDQNNWYRFVVTAYPND